MNTMSIIAVDFFDTSVGKLVSSVLAIVGVAVVLFGIIGGIQKIASGRTSEAAKKILVSLLIGAFCLRPQMVTGIVELFASIAEAFFGDGEGNQGDIGRIVSDSGTGVFNGDIPEDVNI